MEYVLKSNIHTIIGETIIADIRSQRSAYYFFVGGADVAGQTYSSDADDSYAYELATRNEIVSLKRIQSSDVSFVIPRLDWVSGTVYDKFADYSIAFPAYSGATRIEDANFYVVTDEFKVYKCLANNTNGPSTAKPTSTSAAPFVTADFYRWKYMYTVPLSSRTRFMNSSYIPVQTALSNIFYSSGLITATTILNMGSGYTTANITIDGDGTGAILTPILTSGQITSVVVTNSGSGYTYANLTVGGNGTGAVIVPQLSVGDLDTAQADVELLAVNGSLESFTITNTGSGYSSATVTITGDGTGATADALISAGKIVAIRPTNVGANYTNATVTITGDGTGATAIPISSPFGGHGKNAVAELFATRVSFFSNILNDKNNGITVTNNFRNIGIVRNLKEYNTERLYGALNASACMVINYTGTAPANDDVLTLVSNGKRYRVIQTGPAKLLVQNLDNFVLPGNTSLLNSTSGGSITAVTIDPPTINKFSGDLLMIDNFSINQQPGSQIIIFKTTLKF